MGARVARAPHRAVSRWLALVALLAAPLSLLAQPRAHPIEARWRDGELRVGLSALELADDAVRARLGSGLPQVVELAIEVDDPRGVPIARVVRTDRVIFDLWQEHYRIEEQLGAHQRTLTLATLDEVLEATLTTDGLCVGDPTTFGAHRGERIHVRSTAQLNPPTPEAIHRIRRWLARPGGAASEGDTFFGSFVGLFVNRSVTSADASMSFRSEAIAVPSEGDE